MNLAILSVVLVLFSVSLAELPKSFSETPDSKIWEAWKTKYGKTYASMEEESYRFEVWLKKLTKISKHNVGHDMGVFSKKKSLNKFADLPFDEFKAKYLGLKSDGYPRPVRRERMEAFGDLPDSLNLTAMGYVTSVKDQGVCGSCWSFATTGLIEGFLFRHSNEDRLPSLSQQYLLSCDTETLNKGCDGGWPALGTAFLAQNGAVLEADYPYVSGEDGYVPECEIGIYTRKLNVILNGFGFVWMDEEDLKLALVKYGPISIGIEATDEFQDYGETEGVFYDSTCKKVGANHAMLLVGYGSLDGEDYWLVKNSYGQDWGMDGYILMARNYSNMCGIATAALYVY